jgi:hypothetical protein
MTNTETGRGRNPRYQPRGSDVRYQGVVALEPNQGRGQNGEIIIRQRNVSGDEFFFPEELKEPGWDYQWVTRSVHGMDMNEQYFTMYQAGWRPVGLDSRVAKFFNVPGMPVSDAIERRGQVLMIRDMRLTEQARKEEQDEAYKRLSQQLDRADTDLESKLPAEFRAQRRRVTKERIRVAAQMAGPGDVADD